MSQVALPIAARLAVAGCGCGVRTNEASVISSLKKWWTVPGVRVEEQFELDVLVDVSLERQSILPQFRGRKQFVFATFHGNDTFIFDLRNRRVSAVISEATAHDSAFWNTVLIPIAMGVLGPVLGVAPLHSACLEIGGRGMLVAGLSGAGKSTLAAALAKEGMALVSDDWVYAAESSGRVAVHGLGVPVKLMPETVLYFEELRRKEPKTSLNGELAYEVDAREILAVQVSDCCEPECIVFLERAEGRNGFMPLEQSVAREFFERSAEPLPPEFADATGRRRRIIRKVTNRDCWRFRYGGTPQEGAALMRRFFEETYNVNRTCASAS